MLNGKPFLQLLFAFLICYRISESFNPSLELPPLLEFINGTKIIEPSQWPQRRIELKQLLDQYILGTKPTEIPNIKTWNKLNSTEYNYAITSYYSFTLDVSSSSPIIIEITCPDLSIAKVSKYPIIMSQYNHREWLIYAVQRRFCMIRTPTGDTRDDSDQFKALYPNATWGRIARRAWLDSRILDFIIDILSKQVDGAMLDISNIGIFGHSRNGKQSLIATAYDERISAVVGSSSGMPISAPFRLTARDFYGETVKSDIINNRDWWTQNIQQFFGKENYCPADGHFVTALIAPRYVMFAQAMNDNAGDESFANDKNYLINKQVFYDLLNATKGTITVQHRPGSHHGYVSIQSYLDFFSFAFDRYNDIGDDIIAQFENPLVLHPFSFKEWNDTYSDYINYTVPNSDEPLIPNKIGWLLGEDVLGVGGGYSCGASESEEFSANNNFTVKMMGEWTDNLGPEKYQVMNQSFAFGGYITGNVYYPILQDKNVELPVMIHLHPFSYHLGFVPNYVTQEENNTDPFYYHFATRGVIVVTFHQLGFGERIFEGRYFYDRYGALDQSRFGHMVRDVRLMVDFVACLTMDVRNNPNKYPQCQTGDHYPTFTDTENNDLSAGTLTYQNNLYLIPNVDMSKLTVVGYAIGGAVGIHSAALDDRIMAVATIAGFTPFRNNTNDLPNSGNHYLYDYHGFIPKLGFFEGKEVDNPYDYDDLFDVISPKKVLIYAPSMDRNANDDAVQQCLDDIKPFWSNQNAMNNLTIIRPDNVSNFCNTEYQAIEEWFGI